MSEIFVTGHRNPDTDSIVSAMAYTALRNALGESEYVAARLGSVSDETQRMLDYFGMEAPRFLKNVRTQVKDLDFDRTPCFNASVTMDRAWHAMREEHISCVPVIHEDGTLYGMLSTGDIASYSMDTIDDPTVENLPLFNILSVLEGRLLSDGGNMVDTVTGHVCVAVPQNCENLLFQSKQTIMLCGSQPEMIERAKKIGISCIILCQTEVDPQWLENAGETCIISTPFDASRASRLIYQAIPISRPCHTEGLISFHLDDYIDDVSDTVSQSRFRCYPVLDENDRVVGTLGRYHLLRPRRKRVVLVDHNEMAQSIPGLEQADILAIVDHHRLADIQTKQPINVRNEAVGSTNTIVATMFQEHGVMPSPKLAGLMAAAILSDTVMFKSPTCTKRDRDMAERLSRMSGVSLEDLGKELFSTGSNEAKPADELLKGDFKVFHISGHVLGVGQVTCIDSEGMLNRKDELLLAMRKLQAEKGLSMVLLMLTDVLLEGTQLLYVGSEDTIRNAFNAEPKDSMVFLPRVMSRKKQVIPMLTALWG